MRFKSLPRLTTFVRRRHTKSIVYLGYWTLRPQYSDGTEVLEETYPRFSPKTIPVLLSPVHYFKPK